MTSLFVWDYKSNMILLDTISAYFQYVIVLQGETACHHGYHFMLLGLQGLIGDMDKHKVDMSLFFFLKVCVHTYLMDTIREMMLCRFYTVPCHTLLSVMRRRMLIGSKFVICVITTLILCHCFCRNVCM